MAAHRATCSASPSRLAAYCRTRCPLPPEGCGNPVRDRPGSIRPSAASSDTALWAAFPSGTTRAPGVIATRAPRLTLTSDCSTGCRASGGLAQNCVRGSGFAHEPEVVAGLAVLPLI